MICLLDLMELLWSSLRKSRLCKKKKNVVVEVLTSFFSTGKLLKEAFSFVITLVPNVPDPSYISDFRPIACCSIIYKCITKIMANRLREYLGDLLDSNKKIFFQGRSRVENIHLARELVKIHQRNKGHELVFN